MTKDEALDLALEALENLFGIPDQFTGEGGGDVAVWRLGGSYRAQQAITAIKQARSAPVQEPVAWIEHHKGGDNLEWENPGGKCTPLYTTPPAAHRQWVGLTEQEAAEWRYNTYKDRVK